VIRQPRHPRVAARLIVAMAVLGLLAACTPSVGSLGSPAAPSSTVAPSVEVPSIDATAGPTSPSAAPSPSVTPGASGSPTASPGSSNKPSVTPSPTPKATSPPTAAPSGSTIVRAYFFLGSFTDNAGLAPVLREVAPTQAVATAAIRALLRGPNDAELGARPAMYTEIPNGTKLLGLSITKGVATVDLSQEFEGGVDAASNVGRVAQVVYTITQFPTVDSVRFQLDSQPVSTIAGVVQGDGLTRADFTDQLPAIFVDRPAWVAALGNPGRVSGMANVFEATFRVQLRDGNDRVLVDKQVMASCGTGCWGTFRIDLAYPVGRAQYGTLRVFDLSAKDGTLEHVTEYPVWITPAGS
jgi:Sporulation and spore germination/Immunoglobulin-like domain of bacterial spore germination